MSATVGVGVLCVCVRERGEREERGERRERERERERERVFVCVNLLLRSENTVSKWHFKGSCFIFDILHMKPNQGNFCTSLPGYDLAVIMW